MEAINQFVDLHIKKNKHLISRLLKNTGVAIMAPLKKYQDKRCGSPETG